MSGSFSFTINALRGDKRLLIASIAMWAGSQPSHTATYNGVAGTLLFVSTSAPAYLAVYYWLDDKLPAPGAFSYAGTSNADAAANLILFNGVDQIKPFSGAKNIYNAGSLHPLIPAMDSEASIVSLTTLGSNVVTADAPLVGGLSYQYNNARITSAWASQRISSAGFQTTGDTRTTIGAIALKAYEYPRVPLARLLSRRVSPAMRWWMGA
jgi:hypothetical protein